MDKAQQSVCQVLVLILLCFVVLVPTSAQQGAGTGSAKTEAYVSPFSHLDLFWAGTREECLARGNRVIAKAIALAEQQPEFRFMIESNNFVENFVDSHRGAPEVEELKRLVKQGR